MQVLPLRLRFLTALSVISLFFLGAAAARADQPATAQSVTGWWIDQTGKAGILISPCGNELCGKIEWLRQPLDSAGKPKADIHNPDAADRSRLICGLTMLGGFTEAQNGSWKGGWIYDPDSGNTYKSKMHVGADGKLHIRGYIGIPLIGRTEVMTRPATPLKNCAAG